MVDTVVPGTRTGKIALGLGVGTRPACPGDMSAREVQRGAIRPHVRAPGLVGVDGIPEVDCPAPTVTLAKGDVEMIRLVTAILAGVEHDERPVRRNGGIEFVHAVRHQRQPYRFLIVPIAPCRTVEVELMRWVIAALEIQVAI